RRHQRETPHECSGAGSCATHRAPSAVLSFTEAAKSIGTVVQYWKALTYCFEIVKSPARSPATRRQPGFNVSVQPSPLLSAAEAGAGTWARCTLPAASRMRSALPETSRMPHSSVRRQRGYTVLLLSMATTVLGSEEWLKLLPTGS